LRKIIIFLLVTFFFKSYAQFSFDSILNSSPILKQVSQSKDKFRLQIIYTQVNKNGGKQSFTTYYFNVSPSNYFYCASLVKLPVSILAFQKLNELNIDAGTIMFTDSSVACHKKVKADTSAENKFPSINHYIKKMFLVSDNSAYSRVYEFLGIDYMHQNFTKWGFPNIRIINRYDGGCGGENNFITNPVSFYNSQMKLIYSQKEQRAAGKYSHPLGEVTVGKGYFDSKNRKVNSPKNFTYMNYFTLSDCHNILLELIYNAENKFKLDNDQRNFLIKYLTMLPRDSEFPKYRGKEYYDSYKKYLHYGDTKKNITNTNLQITNIVGQSYGFLADCARFYDKKNNFEFMLSAALYVNDDEIINDGKYEYATIGFPFLAELGRAFYKYELKMKNVK
jgi:hypothetical protein